MIPIIPSRPDCHPGLGSRIAREKQAKSASDLEIGLMRRSETGIGTSIRHISRIECWGSSVAVKKTMKANLLSSPVLFVHDLRRADDSSDHLACKRLDRNCHR